MRLSRGNRPAFICLPCLESDWAKPRREPLIRYEERLKQSEALGYVEIIDYPWPNSE